MLKKSTHSHTAAPRPGFTLIELLVVIAIISLLVSILMPSLRRANELAKQVQCLAQMKGLGTAAFIFASDNEKFVPCYTQPGQDGATLEKCYWQQVLMSEAEVAAKGTVCPEYPKQRPDLNTSYNYYYWFATGGAFSRYGYNHRALGCGGYLSSWGCVDSDGSTKVEASPGTLANPASLIMFYDNIANFGAPFYGSSNWEVLKLIYFPENIQHNEGMNVLFSDGHGEWADYESDYFANKSEYWADE